MEAIYPGQNLLQKIISNKEPHQIFRGSTSHNEDIRVLAPLFTIHYSLFTTSHPCHKGIFDMVKYYFPASK